MGVLMRRIYISLIIYISAASVDQTANATYFSGPATCCDQIEAKFHLYIHQFAGGPNNNQKDSGVLVTNDWTVREGSDPGSKLVARAEGFHFQSAQDTGPQRWYNSFNLVFVDDSSLKGSTLEVRGSWDTESPINWAVVGGTGQFTLAQGIITGTNINHDVISTGHRVMDVSIRIFYRPLN